jgi:hypothetical protein
MNHVRMALILFCFAAHANVTMIKMSGRGDAAGEFMDARY